jgi:putative transposase
LRDCNLQVLSWRDPKRQVVGFTKGKSAIHLARLYGEQRRNFVGQHFWARRNREEEDKRLEQMNLWR